MENRERLANVKYVMTHPGKAHRDDFIAVSCLLAEIGRPVAVYRETPMNSELDNPDVAVVDVGMRLEPRRLNFDHHQLPRDHAPACALTLMTDAGIFPVHIRSLPWYQATAVLDSKGPVALAKELECPSEALTALRSPLEGYLLRLFGQTDGPVAPSTVELMHQFGAELLCRSATQEDAYQARLREADLEIICGMPVLTTLEPDLTGMTQVQKEYSGDALPGEQQHVAAVICPDDRGPGWTLFRYNDDPRLDFSLLESCEAVEFAHKGGFIAKSKEMPLADAKWLIHLARTER